MKLSTVVNFGCSSNSEAPETKMSIKEPTANRHLHKDLPGFIYIASLLYAEHFSFFKQFFSDCRFVRTAAQATAKSVICVKVFILDTAANERTHKRALPAALKRELYRSQQVRFL